MVALWNLGTNFFALDCIFYLTDLRKFETIRITEQRPVRLATDSASYTGSENLGHGVFMKTQMVVSKLTTTKKDKDKKPDWDTSGIPDKDKETGLIPEDVYKVPCKGDSNAVAHHFVQHYEEPETVKDITGNYSANDHVRIFNVGLRKLIHAAGTEALKVQFEDPEARAKRLERLREKADTILTAWINEERKAKRWPTEERYNEQLEKVYNELGIPLDET